MPVFTAMVPSADPIALAAFWSVSALGDSPPAASLGCSVSGSAFFRVAIATKHTTLDARVKRRCPSPPEQVVDNLRTMQ